MSIAHHPADDAIAAFAAGRLDPGQHVALSTHLLACPRCRGLARSFEAVGGALLERMPAAPMAQGALAAAEALLDAPAIAPVPRPEPVVPATEVPGLPGFVRRYRFGRWRWVAPSVHLRRIELPHESETRVFLLRSGPGTKMLQHTHTGLEMTCVLAGAFRQDGERFGPGDFDFGDDDIHHQPLVEAGEDCVCLVAMQGGLRLEGFFGRLMQPLVRL